VAVPPTVYTRVQVLAAGYVVREAARGLVLPMKPWTLSLRRGHCMKKREDSESVAWLVRRLVKLLDSCGCDGLLVRSYVGFHSFGGMRSGVGEGACYGAFLPKC
jgi:hypothetical protein